jgi:arylsulfatase A-like enzyme
MVVAGPYADAPGERSGAFVHFVDLLPTLAGIAGVDPATLTRERPGGTHETIPLDGHSLLPQLDDPTTPGARTLQFTQGFAPSGGITKSWHHRTVADREWKYDRIESYGDTHERFFFLDPDVLDEGPNLLRGSLDSREQAALERLRAELDAVEERLVFDAVRD